jgi:hypothetical protein
MVTDAGGAGGRLPGPVPGLVVPALLGDVGIVFVPGVVVVVVVVGVEVVVVVDEVEAAAAAGVAAAALCASGVAGPWASEAPPVRHTNANPSRVLRIPLRSATGVPATG